MTTLNVVPQFAPLAAAAHAAGISEPTLRYWIRRGLIPLRKVGHRQRPMVVEVALVQRLADEQRAAEAGLR